MTNPNYIPITISKITTDGLIIEKPNVGDFKSALNRTKSPQKIHFTWYNFNANLLEDRLEDILDDLLLLHSKQKSLVMHNCDKSKMTRLSDSFIIHLKFYDFLSDEAEKTYQYSKDSYVSLKIIIENSQICTILEYDEMPSNFNGDLKSVAFYEDVFSILRHSEEIETVADWLIYFLKNLTDNFSEHITELHDEILDIENKLLDNVITDRAPLILIRKRLTLLRRFLAPIKEIVYRLSNESHVLLNSENHINFHEVSEALRREIEELDLCISRTAIVSEELNNLLTDSMNKRIYAMSIITIIFMPATLITGLFGINLAGMPGAETKTAFTIFCIGLLSLMITVVLYLKNKKWL